LSGTGFNRTGSSLGWNYMDFSLKEVNENHSKNIVKQSHLFSFEIFGISDVEAVVQNRFN
jgi:hypothetical protein